jgi:uncharacterized RDD family membrane protein YckC
MAMMTSPQPAGGPPSATLAPTPATPEEIARRYDSSIVVRRWGATWVDFLAFAGAIASTFVLPERFQSIAILFVGALILAYYPVLEHRFGMTLGKLVCRVKVVDARGGLPSWSQTIVRTVLRFFEVNPALLGGVPAGIAVLASKNHQRLGDMAAGTFVLRAEDLAYLTDVPRQKGSYARPLPRLPLPADGTSTDWLLPSNRSGWAIAAGYLGLLSLLFLPAPFALVTGVLGLREIRRHPGLGGRGRAIFGIVMGGLFSLVLIAAAVSLLLNPS